MKLRIGYELRYDFPQPTPAILMLNVHYSRAADLVQPDHVLIDPATANAGYRDAYGNWCNRIVAPAGKVRITADAVIRDGGAPDPVSPGARQMPVEELPDEALVFLLASRFCDSDLMLDLAWSLFGHEVPGWGRVDAVCRFVHHRIAFGYQFARATRTASEAYREQHGVCRDYAHLAIAFCRALNIPARYCTGYLGDVGTPRPYPPGDFAGWFEAFLDGKWHTFDPRSNEPRIGRVLMARGRDAADVAMITTFGPNTLEGFKVWCDEVAA